MKHSYLLIPFLFALLLGTNSYAQFDQGSPVGKEIAANLDTSITVNQVEILKQVWQSGTSYANRYQFTFVPASDFSNSRYPEILFVHDGKLMDIKKTYAYWFKANEKVELAANLPEGVSPEEISVYIRYFESTRPTGDETATSKQDGYRYLRVWKALK